MEPTTTRKPRKLQPDNLKERLESLTLAEKIDAMNTLKTSIQNDKEKLEEQLKLITI